MTASPSFLLQSIIQSIRAGKRTAAFLILGYAVGLLLPTAILAAARHEWLALRSGMMVDEARIIRLEEQAPPAPRHSLTEPQPSETEWLHVLRGLDSSIASVSYKSEYASVLFDGRRYRFVHVASVDPSYPGLFRRFIRRGGGFPAADGRACVVGTALSREMWGGSGIGREIRVGSLGCTVTGETDIHGRRVLVMETGREHFKGWTQFFVKVKNPEDASAVLAKIAALGGPWKAERMADVRRREVRGTYAMFSGAVLISLITFLYALLNIGNIMGLLRHERSKKYGIQMALGARPRTLRAEYFGELLLVTTVSLVLVFCALKTGQPLVERHLFSMRLDLPVMLTVFAFNLLICGISGFVHARRIRKTGILRLIREADG